MCLITRERLFSLFHRGHARSGLSTNEEQSMRRRRREHASNAFLFRSRVDVKFVEVRKRSLFFSSSSPLYSRPLVFSGRSSVLLPCAWWDRSPIEGSLGLQRIWGHVCSVGMSCFPMWQFLACLCTSWPFYLLFLFLLFFSLFIFFFGLQLFDPSAYFFRSQKMWFWAKSGVVGFLG